MRPSLFPWCVLCEDRSGTSLHKCHTYDEARYKAIIILQKWIYASSNLTDDEWNHAVHHNRLKICHINKSSGEFDILSDLPDNEYLKRGWILRI